VWGACWGTMGAHDDAKYILRDPAIERYDDRCLLSSCLLRTIIHLACLTATCHHVQLSLHLSFAHTLELVCGRRLGWVG
jgi:hypothetical protein